MARRSPSHSVRPSRSRYADDDLTEIIDPIDEEPSGKSGKQKSRGRKRAKRIALITALVIALLGGGGLLAGGLYLKSVDDSIERVDAFEEIPEAERPVKAEPKVKNFLMLGSDTRDPDATSGSRTDTIILAHIPGDHSSAQLISIPRDTWVFVPKSKRGEGGREAKINAAFAWGGIPLLVQTIEKFTGVRIDNVIIVDFSGFKEIVDALGGVTITVEKGFTSTHSLLPGSKRTFKAGKQVMDGGMALDYARERYVFADGDFTRIKHQQQVIKAILDKATSGGVLSSPAKLTSFLNATAGAVKVDSTMNLLDTAMELRGLSGGGLSFFTSPATCCGTKGTESVVLVDTAKVGPFYEALRNDDVAQLEALANK
ncbi:LCP family protein [Catellatospora chokoriensis]|uniref:Transcriptional regulator n=1 Tax=Catellatospora chokoriensis TaxID=310353 RepID=A0A8J3KCH8_9ACTN|nr:transcriptional regulator [Catellatospora chokoriensis]